MASASGSTNKLQRALPSLIGVALLALFAGWIYQTTRLALVPSDSMEPTLKQGDLLLMRIDAYRHHEPRRGDIIIFRGREGEDDYYVKRLIGLPGEHVFVFRGRVRINRRLLEETYVQGRGILEVPVRGVVPEKTLFVLGDNRDHSSDSRDFGPIARDRLVGQVTAVIWPRKNRGRLDPPDYGDEAAAPPTE